mmetsp:Transcript_17812/g.38781  ORF Transcript_17812/g.38781 Transcript_17812/m.38781 type:complete len:318 (-) Transcript_17812:317-1270(-)
MDCTLWLLMLLLGRCDVRHDGRIIGGNGEGFHGALLLLLILTMGSFFCLRQARVILIVTAAIAQNVTARSAMILSCGGKFLFQCIFLGFSTFFRGQQDGILDGIIAGRSFINGIRMMAPWWWSLLLRRLLFAVQIARHGSIDVKFIFLVVIVAAAVERVVIVLQIGGPINVGRHHGSCSLVMIPTQQLQGRMMGKVRGGIPPFRQGIPARVFASFRATIGLAHALGQNQKHEPGAQSQTEAAHVIHGRPSGVVIVVVVVRSAHGAPCRAAAGGSRVRGRVVIRVGCIVGDGGGVGGIATAAGRSDTTTGRRSTRSIR